MKRIYTLVFASFFLFNCTSDEKRLEMQMDAILEWIDESGLEFTASGSGLYYHVEEAGNPNRIPDSTNEVSFKHVGYLLDSSIFSNGWHASNYIPLPALVEGFQEGLKIIGEGGRAVIIFPSTLGYGDNERATIPAYSPLIFRVELVSYY